MNLAQFLRRNAVHQPEAEAVVCEQTRMTYAQLDHDSDRLAAALQDLGLASGDRVATLSWNCAELVVTEFALYKGGFVRVPINARLSEGEIAHLLRESGARVLLAGPEHVAVAVAAAADSSVEHVVGLPGAEGAQHGYADFLARTDAEPAWADLRPDDPAVLHFTSGSTGVLKAAVQTQGNRLALMRKLVSSPEVRVGPGGRQLLVGPITHASGMPIIGIICAGGCLVVLRGFDPEQVLATIERERVTHVLLIPTMINVILRTCSRGDFDLSSLERVVYGAAPMTPTRIREAWDFFGPVLAQAYGAGETTSAVMFLTTEDHRRAIEDGEQELLSSCGRPATEAEVLVVDDDFREVPPGAVGEIVVRGPEVVPGYHRAPELTAQSFRDGWFRTGDLATRREDGYVFIVDRKKDMIISGGFNVYCVEVEAVLHRHPDVYDAAVVGVPDDRWGEAVKAVAVRRTGSTVDAEALIEFCGEHLARMKRPRSVDFVDALPVNQNGKIDRKAIRETYWAGADRRVN
ncbi:Acyl-CoA synthetase (AMP-forming)/AMP-acid ligase II [Saccharopolyspora antimicrobica]|uniref:Acyl-CoA synthetase (AMP-forming)/AMP-acid ligase II n=1 Tax=Saccharopolyspora antimicrobica TaxID=455193 RepID=A0A1I5GQH8_9PSEU|nr:long-chain fatty acid--CoA ligase [Saccharopolyspora antimicrobica]RKT87405.1 acyl-CoA synthetase (AMP-forming)/AMP-acid ligase II [Saccharopolyspora antimicrobica]SFO38255.1 Acyl-CoA synthetase (AMP-forming)/AMP-acid ligase II [Saccharopolyspora antimicrobica]